MSTSFTRILQGLERVAIVYEDAEHLAFLEPNPVTRGHLIVLPREEVPTLFDADSASYLRLMRVVWGMGRVVRDVVPCNRVCVAVAGFVVLHAHVHLIPCNTLEEFTLSGARPMVPIDELEELAQTMREAIPPDMRPL